MKKKVRLMRCLAFMLALAMILTCSPVTGLTSVKADTQPQLTAFCDSTGTEKLADYDPDDLYAGLNVAIPYAFYGYTLTNYYGWYPEYFQDGDTDYYVILSDICGDDGYCKLTEENADGVTALDCLQYLSGVWYRDSSYWYEFAAADQAYLDAASGTEDESADDKDTSEESGSTEDGEDTSEESGSTGDDKDTSEDAGSTGDDQDDVTEYTQLVNADGNIVFTTYVQSDLYVNVTAPLDYIYYGLSIKEDYEKYPSYFKVKDEDGNVTENYYEELVELVGGEDAGYVQVSDEIRAVLEKITAKLYAGYSSDGEQYYYSLCYIPASLIAEDPADSSDLSGYVALYNGNGVVQAKDADVTKYFSPEAALDYACWGYSLADYYGWYGPSSGYTYFVDEDGNDIYQEILDYMNGESIVEVDEGLTVLLKKLAKSYLGDEDAYDEFLLIAAEDAAASSSGASYDFAYVAEQYVQTTVNGDPRMTEYTEDTIQDIATGSDDYTFAVSLTDPLDFAMYGYTLEDYHGWYGSYFLDADGNDVYEELAGLMDGSRFYELDEEALSCLKTIARNWYGDEKYWYCFSYVDTGYIECYDQDGYTNVSLPVMQELYINLEQPLQYVMYDIDGDFVDADDLDRPLSLAEAAADSEWTELFADSESDASLYDQLKALVDAEGTDIYGFAPLTEDMIPILKKMAYNRWSAYGDYSEYWDVFCFYKEAGDIENPYAEDENVGEKVLVYGNADLADENAYILTLFGDGFDATEQDDFYAAAADLAEYMMDTEPFDELTAAIKIYAIGCISNESGVSNEDVSSYSNVGKEEYMKDTYFDSSYWSYGTQRLVCLSKEGALKLATLTRALVPDSDISGVIVNSDVYGGSGGDYLTTSLNRSADEIFVHEFGHTCADLADEYYAGSFETRANCSQDSDPETVSWSEFIGVDGVGVYPYVDYQGAETDWYRPSQNCKMQYLGTSYPFCAVCQEELRKAVCADSDVPILFWQPYAETEFAPEEVASYFILRQAGNEATLDELDAAKVHLTYTDAAGNILDGEPTVSGTYTVTASYGGGSTFGAASRTAEMTITVSEAEPSEPGEPSEPMQYTITEGDGVQTDASEDLTVCCDGPLDKFTDILVDGEAIEDTNYTTASGSTILTFSADYLKTLEAGDHFMQFIYTDGKSNIGSFIVVKQDEDGGSTGSSSSSSADDDAAGDGTGSSTGSSTSSAAGTTKTGDSSDLYVWLLLAVIALAAAATAKLKRDGSFFTH